MNPLLRISAAFGALVISASAQPTAGEPNILDLRILATLMAQRGDFEEALALVAKAKARTSDSEGRINSLKKSIEELRDKSAAARESAHRPAPATESPPNR